jgi:hypothetical protein
MLLDGKQLLRPPGKDAGFDDRQHGNAHEGIISGANDWCTGIHDYSPIRKKK